MSITAERLAEEAKTLSHEERLELASLLLADLDDEAADPDAVAAWEAEIQDRIRAIDSGEEVGVSYEEIRRENDRFLGK